MEDEQVEWFNINNLPNNIITNLLWLIPFAVNYHKQGNNVDKLMFGNFKYK